MQLNLQIISGDIHRVENLDLLLIGHRNPLKKAICREIGNLFQIKNSTDLFFAIYSWVILVIHIDGICWRIN